MGDTTYVLSIVLKARDQMAAVLTKARAELHAFTQEVSKSNKDFDSLNSQISSMTRRLGSLQTRAAEVKKEMNLAARGVRNLARAQEDAGDAATRAGDASKKANTVHVQSSKEATAAVKETIVVVDEAELKAQRIEREEANRAKAAEGRANRLLADYRALAKLKAEGLTDKKLEGTTKDALADGISKADSAKTIPQAQRHEIAADVLRAERAAREAHAVNVAEEKRLAKLSRAEIKAEGGLIDIQDENAAEARKLSERRLKTVNEVRKVTRQMTDAERAKYGSPPRSSAGTAASKADREAMRKQLRQEENDSLGLGRILGGGQELSPEQTAAVNRAQKRRVRDTEDAKERYAGLTEQLKKMKRTFSDNKDEDQFLVRLQKLSKEFDQLIKNTDSETGLIANFFNESRKVSNLIKEVQGDVSKPAAEPPRPRAAERDAHQLNERGAALRKDFDIFNKTRDEDSNRVQFERYKSYAAQFSQLSRSIHVSIGEQRSYATAAAHARQESDRLEKSVRQETRTLRDAGREHQGFISRLGSFSKSLGLGSDNVAQFDNKLRGLLVIGIFVFAQQLASALVGLGGSLVAVAGSALTAGGALGGALTSGLVAALPIVGLLAASFARLKNIMDAVKQNQLVQQQLYARGKDDAKKTADNTDAIANAQEGVKAAQDRLAQSLTDVTDKQKALNQARKDGVNEIRDLIQAERDAELAARGAALSQKQAVEALRQAVATGNVGGIESAQLDVLNADQSNNKAKAALGDAKVARRRAETGGIEGLDSVKQAKKSLEDARKSAADASTAVGKAERSLAKAGRQAQATAADAFSAQSKLEFLLAQLSPAERKLYTALNNIRETYKKNFRPITDIFINEFAAGVNAADKLLKDPRVLKSATSLATGVAKQFGILRRFLVSDEIIGQIRRIVGKSHAAFGPLRRIIQDVIKAFLNIAEAGVPALVSILKIIGKVVKQFLGVTDNKKKMKDFFDTGVKNFQGWIDLMVAIIRLFAALTGASNNSGLGLVVDLTEQINKGTQYLKDNAEEVRKYFVRSANVTRDIAVLIFNIGKAAFSLFDDKRFHTFIDLINNAILPGMVTAIKVVGALTTVIAKLTDNPLGKFFLESLVAVVLLMSALRGMTTAAAGLIGTFAKFVRFVDVFGVVDKSAIRATGSIGKLIGKLGDLIKKVPALDHLGNRFKAAGDKVSKFGEDLKKPKPTDIPGGTSTGKPVAPNGYYKDGTPRPATPGKPTTSGTGPSDTRYAGTSPARNAPQEATPSKRGQRLRTGGKVLGAGALIGAAATSPDQRALGDKGFDAGSFGSSAKEIATNTQNIVGAITSVNIGGAVAGISRMVDNLGESIKGVFGGDTRTRIEEFRDNLKKTFDKLVAAKDVKGLKKIADDAKELATQFPEYADALTKVGEAVDTSISNINDKSKLLGSYDYAKSVEDQNNRIIASFALVDEATGKLASNYDVALNKTSISIRDIRKITAFNVGKINSTLGAGTDSGKQALASNFASAADAIAEAMRDGRISTRNGIREINRLLSQSYKELGLDSQQIHELQRDRTRNRKGTNTAASAFHAGDAYGGMIGLPGERGKDTLLRRVGRGEAVLTGVHQKIVNSALYEKYGMGLPQMFKYIKGQHAADDVGMDEIQGYARGGYVQGAVPPGASGTHRFAELLFSHGYNVTSAHNGRHAPGGYHFRNGGDAIDFGDSVNNLAKLWQFLIPYRRNIAELLGPFGGYHNETKFFDGVFPGHGDHIHIGGVGGKWKGGSGGPGNSSGGAVKEAVFKALRRVDIGGNGLLGSLTQGIVDKTRDAANTKLREAVKQVNDEAGTSGGPEGSGTAAGPAQVRKWAATALRRTHHFSPGNLNALVARIMFESGGNPKAINLTDSNAKAGHPSKGLGQTIDATFQSYRDKKLPNDIYNPIANLVASIKYMIARYGHIVGNTGVGYANGGEIPGEAGRPVNILAHAQEWILNKVQQTRLAKLLGTSHGGLRSLLGFHGSNKAGFAGGGEVSDSENKRDFPFTSQANLNRIKRVARGIYELPSFPIKDWEGILNEVRRSTKALSTLSKAYKQRVIEINIEISKIKEGGTTKAEANEIAKLLAERKILLYNDHQRNGAAAAITREINALKKSGGKTTDAEAKKIEGLVKQRDNILNVRKNATAAAREKIFEDITKEGGLLDQMSLEREKASGQLARATTFAIYKFKQIGKTAGGLFVSKTAATELDIAKRNLNNAQTTTTQLNEQVAFTDKARGKIDSRIAQIRKGGIKTNEVSEYTKLMTYRKALSDKYIELRNAQATAIEELFNQQLAVQQAAIDEINKRADTKTAALGLLGRAASALGQTDWLKQINEAQRKVLGDQATELAGRIADAKAVGNTDLVDTLTTQINDLRLTIFESIQQELSDAADKISSDSGKRTSKLDLFDRLQSALGNVGLGTGATVAGQTLTRGDIAASRIDSSKVERLATIDLLNRVIRESPENKGLIESLTNKLADLDVTIAEQTRAAFQLKVDASSAQTGFETGRIDLLKRITELKGTLNGVQDTAGLLALAQQRETVLQNARQRIQGLLDEAIANKSQEDINSLSDALLENEAALLENTITMKDLSGAVTQSFSSTSWQLFRAAVFNGSGGLLPQYTLSQTAGTQSGMGSAPGSGARMASGGNNDYSKTNGDVIVQLTSPTEVADPTWLGEAISFKRPLDRAS